MPEVVFGHHAADELISVGEINPDHLLYGPAASLEKLTER
jgi:hypothetical protein